MITHERADIAVRVEYNLRALLDQCEICRTYLHKNYYRLVPSMIEASVDQQVDGDLVVVGFVKGLHERHEAGLPLQ